MPRIPESEIERVKREADLVALIQSRGVTLEKRGANWVGACPFHGDNATQELIVTPAKGLWRCTARECGKMGNAVQFVEAFDGLSFRHAFDLLNEGGAAAFTRSPGVRRLSTVTKLPCPLEVGAADEELLDQVVAFYARRLAASRTGLDYLTSRGLDDGELVERFRLGFADRSLGIRLPNRQRVAGARLRERLTRLGVYRESGHEHLNGCLVVPLTGLAGGVRQLYGRRVDRKAPKDKRHLYLAGQLAGVFNPGALEHREIILAGSVLDALTFVRHGMAAATCTFGARGFTDELFDAIKAARIESVRLAFGAGRAGDAAASAAAARLQGIGVECHRVGFPWGVDASAFALDRGGEALRQAVRSAEWLGCYRSTYPQRPGLGASEGLGRPAGRLPSRGGSKVAVSKPATPELGRRADARELRLGDRVYRVGGLEKNGSLEVLKVTLRLCEPGGLMHVDSLDLYRDLERRKFTERAAEETALRPELIKRDLGKLLLVLEAEQEARLVAPAVPPDAAPEMSDEEHAEAMALLKSPDLLDKLGAAFKRAGIVGEETNALAAYLACASRKLAKPLAVIIQSTSAAGKTTLMEAVLSFFPEEEQIKYSAMTGQSLYYLGETNLRHKILAIVEEEGAKKASYALKLLQSEGELTIASTGKDPGTGRMETQEYHVEGPVAIVFTTTSIDIDEELMNRCLVLTVDESRDQTERIHELQREARTVEGILAAEGRKDVLRAMKNAQRLLKPWKIANPYARELTFTSGRTRTRRDHEKYLTLVDAVALLHQHGREPIRREVGGEVVEMLPVTVADIEAVNRIAPEVLGRSLDELPPQTCGLLEAAKELVRARVKEKAVEQHLALFTRRELREATGWSYMQVKRHLDRLAELEVVAARHGRNGSAFAYELLVDADEPRGTWHLGLIDTAKLKLRRQP